MFPLDPSDVALIADLVLATFLALYFALGRPRVWYRDRLGWVIFGYALATVALLALIVYGVVAGQKVIEPVRFIVGAALGTALIAKTWSVYRERRAGRLPGERLPRKRKAMTMSINETPNAGGGLSVGETVSTDSPKVDLGKSKAIVAAVGGVFVAVGGVLAGALSDGAIDLNEGIALGIAVLVGLGVPGIGTYVVPTTVTRKR